MLTPSRIAYIGRRPDGTIVAACEDGPDLVDTVAEWLREKLAIDIVPAEWVASRIGTAEVWEPVHG